MANLSAATRAHIATLFPPGEREVVAQLLREQCGNNLPFLKDLDEFELERFQFAALKCSDGDLAALRAAVDLAKDDWRDLLVSAGFGDRVLAHKKWRPESPRKSKPRNEEES